jgi:hypothetical protein
MVGALADALGTGVPQRLTAVPGTPAVRPSGAAPALVEPSMATRRSEPGAPLEASKPVAAQAARADTTAAVSDDRPATGPRPRKTAVLAVVGVVAAAALALAGKTFLGGPPAGTRATAEGSAPAVSAAAPLTSKPAVREAAPAVASGAPALPASGAPLEVTPGAAASSPPATAPAAGPASARAPGGLAAKTGTAAPSASAHPAAPSAAPAPSTPPAPTVAKPSCDPPYYYDARGNRVFKQECL